MFMKIDLLSKIYTEHRFTVLDGMPSLYWTQRERERETLNLINTRGKALLLKLSGCQHDLVVN